MKKAFLVLVFLAVCGLVFAGDVITHQIRFKKLIFQCQDGTKEVVDASATGGNTYEHTCKDGKLTNKFINYDGIINLSPDEYERTDSKELADLKSDKVEDFIYQKNNPPEYVEPTPEELQKQIDELDMQKQALFAQKQNIESKLIEKPVKEIVK